MKNIEIAILNPQDIQPAQDMMVAMARLTQSGQNIHCMQDLLDLLAKPYKESTAQNMANLPHDTIRRFGKIHVAVVGASRRFLAQITRHQVGVTFMSASLHYGDYTGKANFVVPYDILEADNVGRGNAQYIAGYHERNYLATSSVGADAYNKAVKQDINIDNAGYMMPQGMRNVLIISAEPHEWCHIITTRTCRRNAQEIRYVCLRILEEFQKFEGIHLFDKALPQCLLHGKCPEGKMQAEYCMDAGFPNKHADVVLDREYQLLRMNKA